MEVDLSFKLSGKVESLLVNVGDRVEVGQKIATIDRGTLPQQLSQAQHQVEIQKKTLKDMERKDDVYSYFQKEAQRAVIKSAEDSVRQIVSNINETTLYSPISGMVIKKNVEVGETTVANAVTSNTSVVTVASEGDLQIQVEIPESDIVDIKLGQKAEVTLDAFSIDEKFEAEIFEIEPASTVIQDVVYYKVKLKFANSDERFKVGMSADADIRIEEKNNVVMVSGRAVKNENGQDYVEILNADRKTSKKVNVKTGFKGNDGMIEIISDLQGGEKVIVLASEK
jgi:HlyD family secretion protein